MKDFSPQSPEARRKRLAAARAKFGQDVVDAIRPGSKPFEVVKRVAVGVYNDGFIHAGNLAYLALLALFPFLILAAAVAHLIGRNEDSQLAVATILSRLPDNVASVLASPIQEVLTARTGPLLWFGAVVGLWTAASFIETIRDILRRAYGVEYLRALLVVSAGIDRLDRRRGAAADDRVRRDRRADLGPPLHRRQAALVGSGSGRRWASTALSPRRPCSSPSTSCSSR